MWMCYQQDYSGWFKRYSNWDPVTNTSEAEARLVDCFIGISDLFFLYTVQDFFEFKKSFFYKKKKHDFKKLWFCFWTCEMSACLKWWMNKPNHLNLNSAPWISFPSPSRPQPELVLLLSNGLQCKHLAMISLWCRLCESATWHHRTTF